jgi:hypothetical protein
MDEKKDKEILFKYFLSEKIIVSFTRSKFTIRLKCFGTLDYVQVESQVNLISKGVEYVWKSSIENDFYLAYLPIERILEVEITELKYDSYEMKLIVSFINGDVLILYDDNNEGIWLEPPNI